MRDFQTIANQTYDLIIIGGGVNGAGVARDAALRGVKTILIEKGDFASGTSSWSTRLVHGGLRYLEYFEFSLVRESLREREILLRTAPHLVTPIMMTIPIYRDRSRPYWKIQAGMFLYDILSFDKSMLAHRMLPKPQFRQHFRQIDPEGLAGGAQYYDAQASNAERLCWETIASAKEAGATVLNYVEMTALHCENDRITRVACRDALTDQTFEIRASDRAMVMNTTGPWVDQALQRGVRDGQDQPLSKKRHMGGTKGSHIVVPPFAGAPDTALYVEAKTDGRPFFIVPWLGMYLIGTTDLKFTSGNLDHVKADNDEVDYLLRETNLVIPNANLGRESVLFTYSGVRPLPYEAGKSAGSITRRHILYDHRKDGVNNLISLVGGKLTTWRHVGEEIVDQLFKRWGVEAPPCPTLTKPLPGAISFSDPLIQATMQRYQGKMPASSVYHLFSTYGRQALLVLELIDEHPELAHPIAPNEIILNAQLVFAARSEMAHTLVDMARRRTSLAVRGHYGLHLLPEMTDLMRRYCDWDNAKCERESHAYRQFMETSCIPDYLLEQGNQIQTLQAA
ncbi:MAG: glycerol-3-phosphate dehydrogenase/oxidase [Cyanobacteria bacterium P01_H01_bin.121]